MPLTAVGADAAPNPPESRPARPPWIKSVRAEGTWEGPVATDISVRSFRLRSDEPVAAGGGDSAPTPMEIIAGALNGCITVVVATVAQELGIAIADIRTRSAAHIDTRGFHGTAEVSPHFQDYRLEIEVATDAPDRLLAELRALSEKRCPALNLVRDAGVPVEVGWDFTAGAKR